MESDNKFMLVLGDRDDILDMNDDLRKLREQGLNFSQSPSVVAIYEIYAEDAMDFSGSLREKGMKVGVYTSIDKARKFFWKSLGFSADGNLDIDDLTVIEPSTS